MSTIEHAAALLQELERRHRLRKVVAAAGYTRSDRDWVLRSDVTRAVAELLGMSDRSMSLGLALRRFLVAEGWQERRTAAGWQWRAILTKAKVKKR